MNYNYSKNFKKFFSQDEIDKMSYNEKFFPTCKCGKKGEFRWSKCTGGDRMSGMFYAIAPFKGRNGEEVCHKCAPCVKCGKETYGGYFSAPHVKTDDNPSGVWALAYCSIYCFNETEKPSLPKKEPWRENCVYCRKLTEVKFGNSNTGSTFCSRDCYVAAGNKIQKGKCRIAGCSQTAYYECMDLCLPHSKPCKGGKINPNGEICRAAMGIDEGDVCEFCKNRNEEVDKKENSRNCSHCGKLFAGEIQYSCSPCGAIYCSKFCCKASAPQCKNKQDKESQDNRARPIKLVVDNGNSSKNSSDKFPEKSPNKGENQTLIIDLKTIKLMTLTSDNNLVIEFNSSSQEVRVISGEQTVNSSQELQAVKNYLQKTNKSSLNQQELTEFFNSSSVQIETPKGISRLLKIGGGAVLVFGLLGWLLVISKRKLKKH